MRDKQRLINGTPILSTHSSKRSGMRRLMSGLGENPDWLTMPSGVRSVRISWSSVTTRKYEDAYGRVKCRILDDMIQHFLTSEEFLARTPDKQARAIAVVKTEMIEW